MGAFQKKDFSYIRCCIVTFLILFLSSSFAVVFDILSSAATIALWILTALIIMFDLKGVFTKKSLLLFVTLIGLMWFSNVVNGEPVRVAINVTVGIVVAFLYINAYRYQKFTSAFSSIMLVLSIISVVAFLAYVLLPNLGNYFLVQYRDGRWINNLYIHVNIKHFTRNCGMFWEPGAYGVFLLLALSLEITKDKLNIKNILIYVITLVTTFSTLSFIALALLMIYFVFDRKNFGTKARNNIILAMALVIVVAVANYEYLFVGVNSVFGKITYFLNGEKSVSAAARYWSLIKPIEAFVRSPLWGIGYEALKQSAMGVSAGIVTCTTLNWFGVYGLIFGIIMLTGFIKFSRMLGKTWFKTLFFIGFLFFITMTEDFIHNSFFYIIVAYGYDQTSRYI